MQVFSQLVRVVSLTNDWHIYCAKNRKNTI